MRLLTLTIKRYDWYCHAYCLMDNHYHLLIETGTASLPKGMKILKGSYTQYFNRQHKRVGHVFQGRFKAILVQKDSYLLELARYIVLNPVRAKMVRSAKEWPWSSYRATAGLMESSECLTTDCLLAGFAKTRKTAQERYVAFVKEGKGQPPIWAKLRNQIYLGDDEFVEDMQCKLTPKQSLKDILKKQKKALTEFEQRYADRDTAMAVTYLSGHYTLSEVGEHFDVSYATVSRAVKAFENDADV